GNGNTVKTDPKNPETSFCNVIVQLGCEDTFSQLQPANGPYWPYHMQEGSPAVDYTVSEDTCIDQRPLWYNDCINDSNKNTDTCYKLNLNNAVDLARFTDNTGVCRCHSRREKTYGYHEPEINWHKCVTRRRNKGLFTADQQLNADNAATTRQDNNGANNRNGFECTEERDYWPYWHPTGWRDIAIKTSDTSLCSWWQSNSENLVGRNECINPLNETDPTYWVYNSQTSCENVRGAQWIQRPPLNMTAPDCLLMVKERTMDNHLGISRSKTDELENLSTYNMKLPSIIPKGQNELKCVLRLRYNISSSNVKYFADATNNGAVTNNPVMYYGFRDSNSQSSAMPLRLAINTAQFGRTFEDRSEVFKIIKRPEELKDANIHNLNVKGKRGNIAQVRNCVEYAFVPETLLVKQGDYVNFQWCGSDFNDPNNNGQGIAGTDRSNVVAVSKFDDMKLMNMFSDLTIVNSSLFNMSDLSTLAWLQQNDSSCFTVDQMVTTQAQNQQDTRSCHFLNAAKSPYFNLLSRMSSRNNAFTNRVQKGVIIAESASISTGVQVGIGMGTVGGLVGASGLGLFLYKRQHNGRIGGIRYHVSGKV
ncbi:hypothetical protein HK096_003463, partial [Nowakowskiella sp. JEL0078]